jgi:hypothetical protein
LPLRANPETECLGGRFLAALAINGALLLLIPIS